MDRFIGPIRPSQHVPKLPKGNQASQQGQKFQLAEDDGDEAVIDEAAEESSEETPDLPVGEARYDESGKRIDYTV